MAKQLQIRGGTTVQHSTFTGALREITIDTDKDVVVVHDGTTVGGFPLAKQTSVDSKVTKVTSTDNAIVRFDGTTGQVQNSAITIDDNGNIGSGTQSFNGFGGSGFKNHIINGGFNIDQYQRGTQSNWSSTVNCYIDRFMIAASSSVSLNGAGNNNPVGFANHLSVAKIAGADTQITQCIEIPKDKAKSFMNGRNLTFSCWILSDVSNFIEDIYFIKEGSSANSYEVKSFTKSNNTVAGVWTKITATISNIQWTYDAGDFIRLRIDPADTLAGTLHTTGWQLEDGIVATPFEQRPKGLELFLCHKYYQKFVHNGANGELYSHERFVSTNTQVYISNPISFKVPMRTLPTVTILRVYNQGTDYDTGWSVYQSGLNNGMGGISIYKSLTMNAGNVLAFDAIADAELK